MNKMDDYNRYNLSYNDYKKKGYLFIIYIFFTLFMGLSIYLGYFVFFKSENFINNPYNARIEKKNKIVKRGMIISSDGKKIALSKTIDKNKDIREYPYKDLFCHSIGYMDRGISGLELSCNSILNTSHEMGLYAIEKKVKGKKLIGDNVITTLDTNLQREALNQITTEKGSIIAMDPSTGAILAEVSKPTFDPNNIKENWNSISNNKNSILLNRATQALYPPGSTFKVLTLLSYLKNGGKLEDTFYCQGSYKMGNYIVHCAYNTAHGREDLTHAFSNSCNVAFSQIGLSLEKGLLKDTCEDFFFNKNISTDRNNIKKSVFSLKDNDSKSLIMSTSFGQGKTLVTPFEMCLVASSVCNHGIIMKPYIIDRVENHNGDVVKYTKQKELKKVMTEDNAKKIEDMMRSVITNGTARSYFRGNKNYTAYGKTGTAEFNNNKNTHSWFIGYAKQGEKQIALAVILENTNKVAASSAEKLFSYYFNR